MERVILLPATSSGEEQGGKKSHLAFGHPVATCLVFLTTLSHQFVIYLKRSQEGGQARAPCCAEQCCDLLDSPVEIIGGVGG